MSTKLDADYANMVMDLKKPGGKILENLTEEDSDLLHMILGICGESGELLDAVKKYTIYRKPLNVENVIEELGDIEFYLEGFRQIIGVTREEILQKNMNKLYTRYGTGTYSDQQAQARADKNEQPRT